MIGEGKPNEKIGKALADEGHRAGVTILDLRYGLEDKPGPIPSILFGLQHVLIMFTAMIASPLVIGQLLNLPPDTRTTMVTGVMLGCGIGTIISALGIGWVGSRLPLLLGAYAVYIGPVVAMAKGSSLAAATTALLIGGIVLGIRTVVFTGVVTNVCVETSAREAFVRDYYVVVASDGTAAYVQADHDMTLS